MEEIVIPTGGGGFCTVMLVLNAVLWTFAFFIDSSAVRQAAYGTMLTGGSVLWGIGALIGRRKTYIITREIERHEA
jgi:hypothetical protein